MSIKEVTQMKKNMKIYGPDESKKEVPLTMKSEKASLMRRIKEEVSQLPTGEVVWSCEKCTLEMSTRVKITRITNKEYQSISDL